MKYVTVFLFLVILWNYEEWLRDRSREASVLSAIPKVLNVPERAIIRPLRRFRLAVLVSVVRSSGCLLFRSFFLLFTVLSHPSCLPSLFVFFFPVLSLGVFFLCPHMFFLFFAK